MKKIMQVLMSGVMMVVLSIPVVAQKIDEQRMERDIVVAENVLSTLIKQQFEQQRMFFPLEIKGSYQPGYGVTFRLPADFTTPIAFSISGTTSRDNVIVWDQKNTGSYSYSVGGSREERDDELAREEAELTYKLKDKSRDKKRLDMDSVRDGYNLKVIEAAKSFIVDYGDFITQLAPNEKIIVTNQGEQPRVWVGRYFNAPKRTHLSIEALRSDITLYKQGKLNREQTLNKIKVVNTEAVDTVEPDMELLSSIFNRLYRSDLSKTFFTEDNIYYERLKDFGVIYYMQVYSGTKIDYARYAMPTLGLEDVDQETRDKKVKEVYPKFEQELKENILEYGRTLKSLSDNEVVIFNVTLTKCKDCGIPSTLEVTVKSAVVKDFAAGKMDKNAALNKFSVKKGDIQ